MISSRQRYILSARIRKGSKDDEKDRFELLISLRGRSSLGNVFFAFRA